MNNVVDEVLNTSATDNKIKYRITHADSTSEVVEIELETPVTTQGTPLNKVLFDSIQDDINTRLLISSKATNSEANTGTNTTKYIVPSTLKYKIDNLTSSDTITTTSTSQVNTTILDVTNISDKIYEIDIDFSSKGSSMSTGGVSQFVLNGTSIAGGTVLNGTYAQVPSATTYKYVSASGSVTSRDSTLHLIVNTITKTIESIFMYGIGASGQTIEETCLKYDTLTTLQVQTKARSSTQYPAVTYSIMVNK